MNSSSSTLNPHANSYIPLSKREVKKKDEGDQSLPRACASSDGNPAVNDLKLKRQQDDSFVSPFQNPDQMECESVDEESEMDLAYLQMLFPGVSDQSLLDVYNVNKGDLEAAIDMLTLLESTDKLPDALDDEAARKPTPTSECSSMNATSGSSTSSVAT